MKFLMQGRKKAATSSGIVAIVTVFALMVCGTMANASELAVSENVKRISQNAEARVALSPGNLAAMAAKRTTTTKATTTTTAMQTTTTTTSSGTVMNFRQPGDVNTLGVWWWDASTIAGTTGQQYLNFCVQNNVSEIYLCISNMTSSGSISYASVRSFVSTANSLGIRVAALSGDYSWFEPNNTGFQAYVDKFNAYQSAAAANEKFYSMHLDVEPHQDPLFQTNRAQVMQWYADFVVTKAVPAAEAAGTLLEFDTPFWLTDMVIDAGTGGNIVAAALMAKYCDTVCVMSYRDTAQGMYDVAVEEIGYAQQYGSKIVLSAETYSTEGDSISYMEEGKAYMVSQLTALNAMLFSAFPNRNYGISIHQIQTWYNLQV